MAPIKVITTVFNVVLLGIVMGGYVAAVWSPFLLLRRLQLLFRIGLTDMWWLNYLLAADVIGIIHVFAYTAGMFLLGSAVAPVEMIYYSGLGVALLAMAVAGVGLPVLGYDRKQGGYMTEIMLLGSAV